MWKCGVFWILLGNISATVKLYKTPKRPCEIKKFTVYDSQIWCQQGRAFVRNLDTPPGRRDSSMKKNGILVASQSGRVSRFICLFELVCTNIRLHFAAISRATKIEKIVLSKTRRQNDFYLRVWEDMGSFIIMVWIKLPKDLEFLIIYQHTITIK